MAHLKITTYPNPILKKKAEPLTQFGPEEQKMFNDMIEAMHAGDGVGIAAPQVGISKRVFIACPTVKEGEEYVIVNPEILEESGSQVGPEGCLSLPGLSAEIRRFNKIHFRFQDRRGQTQEMTVTDWFAKIIQHENDHLDGIVFLDKLSLIKRKLIIKKINKEKKRQAQP